VRVAVGTDSRASNPDLSIWEELRFVRQRYPELSDEAVLRMGTLDAAAALGIEREFGSITVGKQGALIVLGEVDDQRPLWERTVSPRFSHQL
jgi:cytosine/adenosine deaminase-related metal-dependent hydrolase